MRLWTLHPKYLDRKGLVAVWREGLLAQKVLHDQTTGYRHHPQLVRFRQQPDPLAAIASYLRGIADESLQRGYRFDQSKIRPSRIGKRIEETRGQLLYEWAHLMHKLRIRQPERHAQWITITEPESHPLFVIIEGLVQDWEKV